MRNISVFFIFLILNLYSVFCHAQKGIKAGVTYGWLQSVEQLNSTSLREIVNIRGNRGNIIGLNVNYSTNENFYLESGVRLISRRYDVYYKYEDVFLNNYSLHKFFEIPFNLHYRLAINTEKNIFIQLKLGTSYFPKRTEKGCFYFIEKDVGTANINNQWGFEETMYYKGGFSYNTGIGLEFDFGLYGWLKIDLSYTLFDVENLNFEVKYSEIEQYKIRFAGKSDFYSINIRYDLPIVLFEGKK